MIYDENRQLAAVHAAGKNFMLVDASGIDQDLLKRTSEKESAYRKLWLAFFDQIADPGTDQSKTSGTEHSEALLE